MIPAVKLSSPATREFWEIPVLYEDAYLLALDKPSNLATAPDRFEPERPNLVRLLHQAIAEKKPWAKEGNLAYLMTAHRLETETSGVVLLAKVKEVLVKLANLFGSEKIARRFIALIQGTPMEDQFEVEAKLAIDASRPGLMRVDARRGKRCCTRFQVAERFEDFTLLQCEPIISRPQQIRAHLRHLGYSLVGDARYGGRPLLLSALKSHYRLKPGATERPLLARAALHAEMLRFTHPQTGDALEIQAPWPKDFRVAIKYLKRYASPITQHDFSSSANSQT